MKCLRCGALVDLSKPACPSCHTPLDADGDGVPDPLDALVERKVRALLATKAAAPAVAERPVEERLAAARAELAAVRAAPRPIWYADRAVFTALGVVACIIGGALFPGCVEPLVLERSVAAAHIFCPAVCAGCRGPGRIFTWHQTRGRSSGNASTQLCTNDEIDVRAMTWMVVTDPNGPLVQRFGLTLWTSVLVDVPLALVLLFAFGPFYVARRRKRHLASQEAALKGAVAALERAARRG